MLSQNSRAVHVTSADSIVVSGGQTEGMIRSNAIVDLAHDICASGIFPRNIVIVSSARITSHLLLPLLTVMVAKPRTASAIHHHGSESKHFQPNTPYHDH